MTGLFCFFLCWAGPAAMPTATMHIELPKLDVSPYFRPYVAIWLESPDRQGVHTIEVWYEEDTWLKDMRQWWRKLGRADSARYDGVTGATRKAGTHRITWDGRDADGKAVPPGDYFLNFEAAREEGGREFMRQKITIGGASQHYQLEGKNELGKIQIHIHGAKS
ncbi:DUF2271 domain-containing protein [Acanthopleuribacter pedis]|uniref:DUF2271 domain-containing protein n=1 Tax=Acanthopleuribacter pedis TaxID=442870 RepID=A0A8J7QHH0_9BACT|nr:DUF2271 domain-containing protein [Acanthopleuribacter pedis]MBO1320285.1 DUF2271 domain-containing protein [Acanthopleuribacter pedis]